MAPPVSVALFAVNVQPSRVGAVSSSFDIAPPHRAEWFSKWQLTNVGLAENRLQTAAPVKPVVLFMNVQSSNQPSAW